MSFQVTLKPSSWLNKTCGKYDKRGLNFVQGKWDPPEEYHFYDILCSNSQISSEFQYQIQNPACES